MQLSHDDSPADALCAAGALLLVAMESDAASLRAPALAVLARSLSCCPPDRVPDRGGSSRLLNGAGDLLLQLLDILQQLLAARLLATHGRQ